MTSPQTPTEPEQEWYVAEICNELAIVHKLPGEVRPIAAMTCPGLDEDTMKRYANMIVNTLNAAREFVRRCEAGEIRSKRSYAAFKSALEGRA